jgi:hypothetical protein
MEIKDPRLAAARPPVAAPQAAPAPTPLVPESDGPTIATFTHLHDYLTYARGIGTMRSRSI